MKSADNLNDTESANCSATIVFVVLIILVIVGVAGFFFWQVSDTTSEILLPPLSNNGPKIRVFRSTPPFVTNKPLTIASRVTHSFVLEWDIEGEADYIDMNPSPWQYSSQQETALTKKGSIPLLLSTTERFELIAIDSVSRKSATAVATCEVREPRYAPASVLFDASPYYSAQTPATITLEYSLSKTATGAEIITPADERIRLDLRKNGHAGTYKYTATKPGVYVFYLLSTHFDGQNSFTSSQASVPPVTVEAIEQVEVPVTTSADLGTSDPITMTKAVSVLPPPIISLTWNRTQQKGDGVGLPYAQGYRPAYYQPSVLGVNGSGFAFDSDVYICFETGYTTSVRTTATSGAFLIHSRPIGYLGDGNINIIGKDLIGNVYENYSSCILQDVRIMDHTPSIGQEQQKDDAVVSRIHTWTGTMEQMNRGDVVVVVQSLGSPSTFVFDMTASSDNKQSGQVIQRKWTKVFSNVQPDCVNQLTCLNQPAFLLSSILFTSNDNDEGLTSSDADGAGPVVISVSVTIDNTIVVASLPSKGSSASAADALTIQILPSPSADAADAANPT